MINLNFLRNIQKQAKVPVLHCANPLKSPNNYRFNTGVLKTDTVSFTGKFNYDNERHYPYTDDFTQVSMHHDINRSNSDIRYILTRLEKGLPLEKYDKWTLEYISEIDKEFENLPPLEDDFVFYRGRGKNSLIKRFNQDFDVIENAKEGDTIIPDKGYSYGAFKKELAENWSNSVNDNMMLEIHVPKGAKVSRNGEHGGEVVFPRGAEYKLISKEKDRFGTLNVVLEYILPEN